MLCRNMFFPICHGLAPSFWRIMYVQTKKMLSENLFQLFAQECTKELLEVMLYH